MAADPTLADRPLEDVAKTLQILAYEARATHGREDTAAEYEREEASVRAAAVRLRKLDEAISEVRAEFAQALSDDAETSGFLNWIERLDTVLADALGGTDGR